MLITNNKLTSFQRDLIIVKEADKISGLIKKFFLNKTLNVSSYDPPLKAKIIEFRSPNYVVIDIIDHVTTKEETYTFYIILNRYAHITAQVTEVGVSGGRYTLFEINHIAVAKEGRTSTRILVKDKEVLIGNFKISRNLINVNTNRIPTSIKLGFTELKKQVKDMADILQIETLDEKDEISGGIFRTIVLSGKPMLLTDTSDLKSYHPYNRSYFDFSDYLKSSKNLYIEDCKKKGIISEMILPIIYIDQDNTPIPFGYIFMQSKTRRYVPDDVRKVWLLIKDMIKRISEANTLQIPDHELVIDISKNGLMAKIKNPNLIEILRKQSYFTFDLFFKMEAPITLYGLICNFNKTSDGVLLGIHIQGNSSRVGEMERYTKRLDDFEKKHFQENEMKEKKLKEMQNAKNKIKFNLKGVNIDQIKNKK